VADGVAQSATVESLNLLVNYCACVRLAGIAHGGGIVVTLTPFAMAVLCKNSAIYSQCRHGDFGDSHFGIGDGGIFFVAWRRFYQCPFICHCCCV